MYSGVLGTELTCEIYIGCVYYQRVRHIVGDKYQVRSTGAVNPVTRQPVKGKILVVVLVSERWSEIRYLLMVQRTCCMIGYILAQNIILRTFVFDVEVCCLPHL
ncbi:hypothetical protein MPTK1_2g08110 [Marchantia polymorpha subsp. ruderalis]|nr:hypothetical protein Mp_2g08110 [Marchantia polymorpha subsp. ruderalis]